MRTHLSSCILFFTACAVILTAGPAFAASAPKAGDTLPELTMVVPPRQVDRDYLGLNATEGTFTLADLEYEAVLIEIVGVYCPFCHRQAPLFNQLHKRLERSKLTDKVKMIALASGATDKEVGFLRTHSDYAYPVIRDEDFSVYETLGEPKTPFTVIVDSEGTVHRADLGVVEDVNELYSLLKGLTD